jgi:metal iron transporter
MNCPSPVHHPEGDGMNQNPNALSPALTTNEDLNGMANLKVLRRLASTEHITEDEPFDDTDVRPGKTPVVGNGGVEVSEEREPSGPDNSRPRGSVLRRLWHVVVTFGKFVGPGFMVSHSPRVAVQAGQLTLARSPWLTSTPGITRRMWQLVPRTDFGFCLSC